MEKFYRGWRWLVLSFGGATLFGLFFASRYALYSAITDNPSPWWIIFVPALADCYLWAILTWLIFRFHRRFPVNQKVSFRRILIHALAAIGFALTETALYALAMWLMQLIANQPGTLAEMLGKVLISKTHLNILTYAVIVFVGYSIDYYRKFREGQLEAAHLQTRLAEAQLQALRMQLQPHFLFNTLNAVSGLVRADENKTAITVLARLGELLRSVLESDGRQKVLLKQELEFTRKYLELQQCRFPDRLSVEMNIEPTTLAALVPNFILQPIVENAVNHGIEACAKAGNLEIKAVRANGSLKIEISDDGRGLSDDWQLENCDGIGLANTKNRLRQLYGKDCEFEIRNAERGGVIVSLTLPWETEFEK